MDRQSFTLSSGREPEHASEELHAAWQVEAVPSPRLQHPTLMTGEDLGTRWRGLELWCLHRSSPVHSCSPRQNTAPLSPHICTSVGGDRVLGCRAMCPTHTHSLVCTQSAI